MTKERILEAWRDQLCELVSLSNRSDVTTAIYREFWRSYGLTNGDFQIQTVEENFAMTVSPTLSQFSCSGQLTTSDITWCVQLLLVEYNITSCVFSDGSVDSTQGAHVLNMGGNLRLDGGHLKIMNASNIYSNALVSALVRRDNCAKNVISTIMNVRAPTSSTGMFTKAISTKSWIAEASASISCEFTTTSSMASLSVLYNGVVLQPILENPFCKSNCLVDARGGADALKAARVRTYVWSDKKCYSKDTVFFGMVVVDNITDQDAGNYSCEARSAWTVIGFTPVANISVVPLTVTLEPFAEDGSTVVLDAGRQYMKGCSASAVQNKDWRMMWVAPSGDSVPEISTDTSCISQTAPPLFSQLTTELYEEMGVQRKRQILTLYLCSPNQGLSGTYTCLVTSEPDISNQSLSIMVSSTQQGVPVEDSSLPIGIGVAVSFVILFILVAAVIVLSCVLYTRYKYKREEDYGVTDLDDVETVKPKPPTLPLTSDGGSPTVASNLHINKGEQGTDGRTYAHTLPRLVNVDSSYEFEPEKLSVVRELGHGEYGRVVLASVVGISHQQPMRSKVAAKTVKDHARAMDIQALCEEIELMATLEPHPNIINILGYTFKNHKPYLIMEYAKYGDLRGLLQRCKKEKERLAAMRSYSGSTTSSGVYYNVDRSRDHLLSSSSGVCSPVSSGPAGTPVLPGISEGQGGDVQLPFPSSGDDTVFEGEKQSDIVYVMSAESCTAHRLRPLHKEYLENPSELLPEDILNFALQIAQGMEHLQKSNLVHRDLAARNILISEGFVLKIADFGLARTMDDSDYYTIATQRGLPIKWTAPEVFDKHKYSSKSDMWSYSILLWEITAYGDTPYPDFKVSDVSRLVGHLRSGGRPLRRQDTCNEELHELMEMCWKLHPHKRPSFTDVVHHLAPKSFSSPSSPIVDVKYSSAGLQGGDVPPHIASTLGSSSCV